MSDIPPSTPTGGGPKRWVSVLLFASLAVNVLVIGVVAGAIIKGPQFSEEEVRRSNGPGGGSSDGRRRPPGIIQEAGIGPYARALTKEDRDAMRRDVRGRLGDLRSYHEGIRGAVSDVIQVVRRPDLQRADLEAELMDQVRAVDALRSLGIDLLTDRIMAMSVEERAAFADRMQEGLNKARKRPRPPKPPRSD